LRPLRSDREWQPMQSGEVPQKSIALHRAVKAMPKRNVEGSSASRPVRIKGGTSDVPSRSLGAAMGLEMGRVDVQAMPTGSHGGTAKEGAVENRGTRSLVIPAWLRYLSSLPAKVAKVKMKGAFFCFCCWDVF
jgi:hypothetical protein